MSRIAFLLLMALFAIVKCQNTTNTTITPTNSTTEPTTNTTTAAPTTAAPTTASPTTTSAPTPTPIPKAEEWKGKVTEGDNTCINVEFAVEIRIKYNNTNGTEVTTGFNIPINATVDEQLSSCRSNNSQIEAIVISFVDQENTSANLTLRFNSTKDKDNVFVEDIELSYILTEQLFPSFNKSEYNKIVKVSQTNLTLFSVATSHSYVCSEQKALLENEDSSLRTSGAQIDFIDSKVQAYIDKSKKGEFDSEINCKPTEISDVVPIAVGAALAGLVLIVLIAYFIGRRRSRRLAYQSV